MRMNRTFLSLGSNLGDRSQNLKKGIVLLEKLAGKPGALSSIYETEPWGCDSDLNFYNQVIELFTPLRPLPLLEVIHEIEKKEKNRIIDSMKLNHHKYRFAIIPLEFMMI